MAKSLTVAFLLWGTLGIFGAHHFYLGRDRHGIVHLVTLGGFVVGWLYDAFHMRYYVQWANLDVEVDDEYLGKTESGIKPVQEFLSETARAIVAYLLWSLVRGAIVGYVPDYLGWFVGPSLLVLVLAYGVYFLGNIGESEGSFWSAAEGALLTAPYYMYNPEGATSWCLMASAYTFGQSAKARSKPEDHGSKLRRFCRNAFIFGIILSLATLCLFNNCTLKADEDGEEVQCIDAMKMFYNHVRYNGFRFILEGLFAASPEANAADVLGVSEDASEGEIKAVYRALARNYHPDRIKNPEKRRLAHQEFMKIGNAYKILMSRNKKPLKSSGEAFRETEAEL